MPVGRPQIPSPHGTARRLLNLHAPFDRHGALVIAPFVDCGGAHPNLPGKRGNAPGNLCGTHDGCIHRIMISGTYLEVKPRSILSIKRCLHNGGMTSEMWQRIRAARKHAQFTQDQLAERVGVSKAAVGQWEAKTPDKRTRPTIENLKRIALATGAPVSWLVEDSSSLEGRWMEVIEYDEGDAPLVREAQGTYAAARGPAHPVIEWSEPADLPDNEFAIVERRAVKLAAGDGHLVFEDEPLPPLAFRAEFLRSRRVTRRSNLVIVYADGDSMMPSIMDGDSLLCDRGQIDIIDGEIYAIDYNGNLRVKRLQKRFDGGLLVISDNSAKYPPEVVSADQAQWIKILGRVLWRGGSL